MQRLTWASRLIAVAVVTLAVGSCGGDDPVVATTISVNALTLTLDGIGATQLLTATVSDKDAKVLTTAAVAWTSDADGVVTVSSAGLITAVTKGTATITAASGSISAKVTVTVTQTPSSLTKVTGDAQTGGAGAALGNPIVVQVKDTKGSAVAGATVNFTVSAGGGTLGSPSVTTGANGQATNTWTIGATAGATQTILASVVGIAGTTTFTATATAGAAAKLVLVSGNSQSGVVGAALGSPIVVKVTDANNNAVAGTTVNFGVTGGGGSITPSSQASAASGQAQAAWTLGGTGGAQTMQATAAGLTGSPLDITATAASLGIASFAPDTLTEGTSVVISGAGFSSTLASNAVTIDGAAATVTAATATSLTVTIPAYDCKPARDGNVQVTVGAVNSNVVAKRIHPASFVSLAVGAQTIISAPANFCLQFRPNTVGGDGYVVGVAAAAELPSAQFPISISTGTGASSLPILAAQQPLPMFARQSAVQSSPVTPLEAEVAQMRARQRRAEAVIRASEQRELPRLMRMPRSNRQGALASAAPVMFAAVPAVGDVVSIKVPDFTTNGCVNFNTIQTKVKWVGTSGVWLSDPANPGPDSLTDNEIKAYSDTLDNQIYAADVANFGAPSDIDGNQRIVIVLTIRVNKEPIGAAGFVYSADLFPASGGGCPSSNFAEIFYSHVPDAGNAGGFGARSHASVAFQMPSLIAHEFSHVIQTSRRTVLQTGSLMNSWEMEGQAVLAQELVGHQTLGNSPGNNYTANFLLGPGSVQNQRWYKQGFDFLGAYFGFAYDSAGGGRYPNAPDQCSLFASTGTSNIACFSAAFYGASWMFQRYVIDRFGSSYAGGPTQLSKDVISKNINLSGRANWEALLGLTPAGFDSLYAQYSAMLYVDDRVAGATAVQQMSSWNLFNVLSGFDANHRLVPTVHTFSLFNESRTVNGGGTAYTTISSVGAHAALAVKVRNNLGGVLSSTARIQLWITRVQ